MRALFAICCGAVLVVVALMSAVGAGAAPGELVAQPSFGAPTKAFLGGSPLESPGEVWATTKTGSTLAKYTDAGAWETLPQPLSAANQPIESLVLAEGPDAGRTTPRGGIVLFARGERPIEEEEDERYGLLIVRDPGGTPREVAEPPEELFGPGEFFLPGPFSSGAPLLSAQEASGGATRALVVPTTAPGSPPKAILSGVDGVWARESICVGVEPGPCQPPPPGFTVLAIDAAGGDAWLLARGAAPEEGIELFRRETGGSETVWRQQSLGPDGSLGSRFAQAEPAGVLVAASANGQALTVSGAGVWFDARLSVGGESYDATAYYDLAKGEVVASWCDLATPSGFCTYPLAGSELPAGPGRSFAWPPNGSSEPYGRRVVTGVGEGAILSLEGNSLVRIPLAGGESGTLEGAAFDAPDDGWLGDLPPLHVTRNPEPDNLQPWPVPFRRPLTAIAPEPGAAVGALGSEALAVGELGQVARYTPGVGWEPEFLLTGSGKRAKPTLRGVAWPTPDEAYAVGDEAEMWLWRRATQLWEPDPGEPPDLVTGNFTGIAFDPGNPNRGYAIGKQGLLLSYSRTWVRESLPPGVPPEANLTSIAFAGGEAFITWKYPVNELFYTGGVLVNDGSGWRVEQSADQALRAVVNEAGEVAVPQLVAGLPDGGAVIALLSHESATAAIERQGPGAPWQPAAGGTLGQQPVALAAVREGGQVRALISVGPEVGIETDREQIENQPPPGQAPLLTHPYRLPESSNLARQTATGWRDEQHGRFPIPRSAGGWNAYDLPTRPSPTLAMLVSPDGSGGWMVGGETGTNIEHSGKAVQTADVMRYGTAAAAPANAATTPIGVPAGTVNFAVGGHVQCAGPCADLAATGIAPDRWLRTTVGTAAGITGLRAFLYTGASVAPGGPTFAERLAATLSPTAFGREESAYARRLASAAGSLPVYAAADSSDLDRSGSLSTFLSAFSGYGAPLGTSSPGPGVVPVSQAGLGTAYYSFASAGAGGTVRVIVLDYSAPTLGGAQRCWLADQLDAAGAQGTPAIVVGARDLGGIAPNSAEDAAQVKPIITRGIAPAGCPQPAGPPTGASAYFFDYPEQNRTYSLTAAGRSVPAFGNGALGYVAPKFANEFDYVGAAGFLLGSIDVSQRNPSTNVAPVSVRLIPNIGSLALDATDGTLLRRSQPALFDALARRPRAGAECIGTGAPSDCEEIRPDPYVPIPTECHGARCATGLFPEYTFTSSEPDIADFVEQDPASPNPRNVLLVDGHPVLSNTSGLLCTFNAGTTTVTVSSGGLSYSEKVRVFAGTAERPCGTVPLRHPPTRAAHTPPPPPPPPSPAPAPAPAPLPPVPPPPAIPPPAASPAAKPTPPPVVTPLAFTPFFAPQPEPSAPVPIVPPPPPAVLQPTPPSGTAQVTQEEEEEEEAYEQQHSMTALVPGEGAGGGGHNYFYGPVLAVILAIAAAAIGSSRPRRSRRRLAYNSNTSGRYR
ncbi:MAG TPA: hypothetical protein VH476_01240 [Solirubrobacterales bacterium]